MHQVRARLGHVAPGDDQRDDADGHVHEEDPAPGEELGQDAAQERAGRGAGRGHGAPCSERPRTGRPFGERRGEDGQRRRGQDGGTEPLQRPGRDQPGLVLGQPAEEAGHREQGQADEEDLAPPVQVRGAATEKQEAGEGQRVGVDDPLQPRSAEVQVTLDRGQGDVDDGSVEDDHELTDEDDAEHEPRRDRPARPDLDGGGVVAAHGVS